MKSQILTQAAEAIIYKKGNEVIKDRIPKSYRIKILDDKIRKSRTKSETKLLTKASQIINCPIPKGVGGRGSFVEPASHQIKMPFVDGKKLSEHLNNFSEEKQKQICEQIGESVAKLHDANIIHGDLTTSNMILVENLPAHSRSQINEKSVNKKISSLTTSKKSVSEANVSRGGGRGRGRLYDKPKIFFIDFGLGFISHKIEDKAVDLHLLKQALEAKHFQNWEILFKKVIKSYSKSKDSKKVLEQLKAVEKRGRYKH